jgi:hypothetical protein
MAYHAVLGRVPRHVMAERPAPDADHEPTDADDRIVELDDPEQLEPPIDDEDRDPARRDRQERPDDTPPAR